ncbi:hypothetical protein HW555_014370, partial [Spodoptera exigua]
CNKCSEHSDNKDISQIFIKDINEKKGKYDPETAASIEVLISGLRNTDENPETDALYRDKFAEIFTFFRDSPYSMAVVLNGESKKSGIQQIIEKLALGYLPTYAFGDGNNDIGMFEAVDIAIAMENASDYVKGQADFVTKSNVNGGIRFGLQQFNLIN